MNINAVIGLVDTNCFLVEEKGRIIIIDPVEADSVSELIDKNGWKPDYIFLSHEHFDHVNGLEEIRKKYSVPVVASNLCSERIQQVNDNLSRIADLLHYFKTGRSPEKRTEPFVCRSADITFDDYYEMSWQGHKIKFRRAPGHSPGSVLISVDDNIVFTGDYMFFDSKGTLRLKGGSEEDYERYTVPLLESIPIGSRIYPGHGQNYTKK